MITLTKKVIVWEITRSISMKEKHLLSNKKAIEFAKKNCISGGYKFLRYVSVDHELKLLLSTKNIFGIEYTFTKRQWEVYTNV